MSTEDQKKGYSRRSFLKGSTIAALGVAAGGMGLIGGCSTGGNKASTAGKYDKISEQVTTDIVVVGGGASGLCACIQAKELGAKVVLLEGKAALGGCGIGTEGVFAIGTDLEKKAGINLTMSEVIAHEQEFFNYGVNALRWQDMLNNSADNIAWLQKNGVIFSGVVNDYAPLGKVAGFHWFQGKGGGGPSYMEPLGKKAKEIGVEIRMETSGMDLIMENGHVAGIYAVKSDKSVVRINCKAVILATGGFINNDEMLKRAGVDLTKLDKWTSGGHNGDGIRMAVSVGARDLSQKCALIGAALIKGHGFMAPFNMFLGVGQAAAMWVNENGERFADENCVSIQPGCGANAMTNQKKVFSILDQEIIDSLPPDMKKDFEDLLAAKNPNVYKADSIGALAGMIGVPADTLTEHFNRYNRFCEQHKDEDFGKAPATMKKLKAPLYGVNNSIGYATSIGGVLTSRNSEALTEDRLPIPGLYATGVDGCMLYGETYTFSVPGSANCNNVNSGRTAAKHAVATILKA